MMDVDDDVDMLHEHHGAKQCFSVIQNRKLPSPLVPSVCSLCPSMDLIVLAVGDTLWIHRTVSWQRLATLKQDDCEVHSVCWAPDGRSLAVVLSNGTIALHNIEALSSEEDLFGDIHTLALPRATSLMWAHVGRPHPTWTLTLNEMEREETWHYQSRYLDRASTFLPPTSYHIHDECGETIDAATTTHPTCQTPLSLLCATTKDKEIHLYLHGRYPIATLTCSDDLPVKMVCTSNLTHLLVQGSSSSRWTLYHLPALAEYRYPLQVISSLYCSMTSHLMAIQQCIKEISAAWKSSLKPLDMKLDSLKRLLKNYDVSKDVCTVLHEYMIVGSVEGEPVTSAIDQFFSNVAMNDQLIQRLERSLHGAVANVETLARRGLLSPARSLAYEAGDLQSEPLITSNGTVQLQRATAVMVLAAEDVVARIVEARFRLRDLVSWLRSAGSQVKARGTAPNSGQRENAKKRRVPHAVTERMALYFQQHVEVRESVTESLIGISIAEFFSQEQDYVVTARPASPKSVHVLKAKLLESKRPTVAFAFKKTQAAMDMVFEQPKAFVSQSITQTKVLMSPTKDDGLAPACAIHSRIGGDANKLGSEAAHFFNPQLVYGDEYSGGYCRSWSILARVASFQGEDDNSVHIFALPLDGKSSAFFDNDMEEDEDCSMPFYLSSRLVLPPSYRVQEVAFYGDDGNSSLSAGADGSGTGQEGRQAMGLLVTCPSKKENGTFSEELWLVQYDQALYHRVSFPSGTGRESLIELDERALMGESVVQIQPLQESTDEDGTGGQGVLRAKTRLVSLKELELLSKMLLSGSRGVGGILTNSLTTGAELILYDLEEDEEGSDNEEE